VSHLTPEERAILDWLKHGDEDPHENPYRPLPRGTRRPEPSRFGSRRQLPPPPKPGTLARVLYDHTPSLGTDAAERTALMWAREYITPKEARDWLAAGLGVGDLHLVATLRAHQVPPAALGWRVNGDTILDKLKVYGRSVADVSRLLRREKRLPPLSA
jgi:hypothetical protein